MSMREDYLARRQVQDTIKNSGMGAKLWVSQESRYVAPFAEGRYLEIAKGNDETGFGRAACLDLNDEIVKIARAGEGLALYWRENGPQVLADHRSCIFTKHVPPHR